MDVIRPLSELTLADIETVGGKAAHLGAMLRAGFAVPPGFVIDVNAFTSHFGTTTDPLVKPAVPRLQPELMANVVEAIREHLGSEHELAVRSSSTSEDSQEASFAGQHATYYFVPPSRIDQAILDCWMSLWSDAALAYRRSGVAEIASGEPVRMAVIIQQMVRATRAGVAFSRDPLDAGGTDCVIEASWGLGAALVDGRVTPDQIRVSETGALRSYSISDKQYLVSANPTNPEGKRLDEVPRHQACEPALTNGEAERIANIAAQLEALFESPQDVEWAYAGDELKILQSRSITRLATDAPTDRRLVLFKPLAENFTEPLTPMSEDLYARVLPNFGEIIDGRFYIDIDLLKRIIPFKVSETELVDLALLRKTPDTIEFDWRKLIGFLGFIELTFLVDGATWLRAGWLKESGLARYEKLANAIRNDPNISPPEALRRLFLGRHPFEPLGHHMVMVNITAGRYFFYLGLLRNCIRRFAPSFPEAELNKTFHGQRQMHSLDLLDETGHLARLLEESRQEDDCEKIESVLRGESSLLPTGHPFTIAIEKFLAKYGHRGSREMELAAPRWRESIYPLLAMVASDTSAERQTSDPTHGGHLAALDLLHQALKPWQRIVVDHLIRQVAKYTALRENTRHYHIMGFAATRAKLLDLEQELLFNDLLKMPGDIFFLRYQEARDLETGSLSAEEAHRRIRRRRRSWSRASRRPIDETINITPATDTTRPDSDALRGQCACPGSVEGVARVVHSLQEANALNEGEILVAPYTDPSWTPLFPRAGGIVVGMGSYLSHAGTIARELHVPCIVDVRNCTSAIANGQRIRLNADLGTVEVLE